MYLCRAWSVGSASLSCDKKSSPGDGRRRFGASSVALALELAAAMYPVTQAKNELQPALQQ